MKLLGAAVLLSACATGHGGGGGGVMPGVILDPGAASTAGVELRAFAGAAPTDPAVPNVYGVAWRQLGGDVHTTLQWGWGVAGRVGDAVIYGRLMFDVIGWESVNHETRLTAFSPTADLGIAPFGHGVCLSASATWDIQYAGPDRALLGAFVGMCAFGK